MKKICFYLLYSILTLILTAVVLYLLLSSPPRVIKILPAPQNNAFIGERIVKSYIIAPPLLISPVIANSAQKQATTTKPNPLNLAYDLIDTLKPDNSTDIKKLVKCESDGENVSRPDSDGIISDGILQFHRASSTPDIAGSGTWSWMSKVSGIKGSPNNPRDAILMTDWAIDSGYLSHWSCARILKLL